MRKINSFLLFLLLAVSPAFSAAVSGFQPLALKPPAPAEIPAVPNPFYTPQPERGGYDWTGLPAYIFTEQERLAPPIIEAINRTKHTLDIALYNLQITEAVQAMMSARDRGVRVRVIFDYAHVYPSAGRQIQAVIDSGIDTRVMKGRGGSGSMHCKYAVYDGELLETGSANWSLSAENASYENIMFVPDPHIIQGYRADFEWMWSQAKPAGSPGAPSKKPVPPPADPAPSVNFNGTVLPSYIFSPRGGTEGAIVRAIDASTVEVDVAMFSFTSKPIMEAFKRASARGVKVKLLLYSKSAFPFRQDVSKNRIELRLAEGRVGNGLMHNKFAVLDRALLVNGSFNWSATAENLNTENTIFTMSPAYVAPYKAEFDKLFLQGFAPN